AGLYEFARTAETDEFAVRAEPAAAWDWAGESKWTAAADWPESLGTGAKILRSYKDGWVRGHREAIKKFASGYDLPAELLAGIAWIETGGRGDIENYDTQTWGDTEMLDQLNFSEFTTETELEMDQIQDEFQRALEYLD